MNVVSDGRERKEMTAVSNYAFRAKESYSFLASPFVKFNMLASKRKNKEPKCWCFYGWICEDHPDKPWGHKECGAAADLCKNPQCVKIRTPFFYQSTLMSSLEEERRQLEKLCYQVG